MRNVTRAAAVAVACLVVSGGLSGCLGLATVGVVAGAVAAGAGAGISAYCAGAEPAARAAAGCPETAE